MILMKANVTEAKAFVQMAKELGVDMAIFSQIFAFGDRPDWVIRRNGQDFVYSHQLLDHIRESVSKSLHEALVEAGNLKVNVVLHDNVASYVPPRMPTA